MLLIAIITVQVVHSCKNMPRAAQARAAASNYQRYCAGCHGDNLEKFAAKQWMEEEGISSVEHSIKHGILDIGMPAFAKTFTDKEIEELAVYVKRGIPSDRTLLKPAIRLEGVLQSEEHNFVIDTVVTGLEVPWGLAFLPNTITVIETHKETLFIPLRAIFGKPNTARWEAMNLT